VDTNSGRYKDKQSTAGKFNFLYFMLSMHKWVVNICSIVSLYTYLCNYLKLLGPRKLKHAWDQLQTIGGSP